MYPQQSLQFIPQGAIKSSGMVVVGFWSEFFMIGISNYFSDKRTECKNGDPK